MAMRSAAALCLRQLGRSAASPVTTQVPFALTTLSAVKAASAWGQLAPMTATQLVRSMSSAPLKAPAPHKGLKAAQHADDYMLMHPVYTPDQLNINPHHREPVTFRDRVALRLVSTARTFFDNISSYHPDKPMPAGKWLERFIYLEAVAAIPGMVGGALRHLQSLRLMKRDNGWIHTLLEEAENERMHLLTFIQMKKPGPVFRGMVILTQGVVYNLFFLSYILSPKTCHRFVGYLEEEAVRTYTHAIHDIEAGHIPEWSNMPAPDIAKDYWRLGENAKVRDLLLAVRADEACHSHVNHTLSTIAWNAPNPFRKGHTELPEDFTQLPEGAYADGARPNQPAGAKA